MSTHNNQLTILNNSADYWFYDVGVNVIPANTKNKNISISWKEYQDKPIPKEVHESRKKQVITSMELQLS